MIDDDDDDNDGFTWKVQMYWRVGYHTNKEEHIALR